MVRVESDFIKRLQPHLCPQGAATPNAPWCNPNPEPVDIDAYKKFYTARSYFPFKPPMAVRFCTAFKAISVEGVCHTVDPGVQDEISAMINAPKKKGAWPSLPNEAQLYRKLSRAAMVPPPGLAARLETQIKARAKKIRDGIIEARDLDDKGKKEEAKRKREKLEEELIRVCTTDDTYATLTRVANDCNLVIDKHLKIKNMWTNRIAAGAVTFALAVLGLAAKGILRKMFNAAREKWRATKPPAEGGVVKRFFRNSIAMPGRMLKSAWAAIRAKEGASSGPAPVSRGAGASEIPSDIATPLPIKKEASDSQVSLAFSRMKVAIGAILNMKDRGSTLGEWIERMTGLDRDAGQGVREKFGAGAAALRSRHTIDFIRSAGQRFRRRFFNETVPDSLHALSRAAELARGSNTGEAQSLLEGDKWNLMGADGERLRLDATRAVTAVALEEIRGTAATPPDGFEDAAALTLSDMEGLTRDAGAILEKLRAMNSTKDIGNLGELLAKNNLSIRTVGGLLTAAQWINSYEASRHGGMRLHVEGGDAARDMAVPSCFRKDILRLYYYAGNNCVRHSNPDATEGKNVIFRSYIEDGKLILSILDNGVGMSEEKRREVLAHQHRGFGIFDMIHICEANGWRFELASEKDKGTEVRIAIDTSDWHEGAPSATGGSVASQLPSGGGVLAGMMPAAVSSCMLGAGVFAGMIPMIV